MANVIQILRSVVAGRRPLGRAFGELFANLPDLQLGIVNDSGAAVDLIGVRFFSTLTAYVAGDHAIEAGALYRCIAATGPGAFDPASWAAVGGAAPDLSGYLPLAGGVMTGPIVSVPGDTIDGADGTARSLSGATSGSKRWEVQLGNVTPETGANAGSDFSLTPHDDTGAGLAPAVSIERATSLMTLALDPVAPLHAATKRYVDQVAAVPNVYVGDTPPAGIQGAMWFNSLNGQLYVWYDDGTSGQWVIAVNTTAASSSAINYFSDQKSYAIGDHVVEGGMIYRAEAAIAPAAFNPVQWVENELKGPVGTYARDKFGGTITVTVVGGEAAGAVIGTLIIPPDKLPNRPFYWTCQGNGLGSMFISNLGGTGTIPNALTGELYEDPTAQWLTIGLCNLSGIKPGVRFLFRLAPGTSYAMTAATLFSYDPAVNTNGVQARLKATGAVAVPGTFEFGIEAEIIQYTDVINYSFADVSAA
jgi:hypothetical protein